MEGSDMYDTETRNERIFRARCSGKTLEFIGSQYGLNKERVREIVVKFERKAISYDAMKARMQKEIDDLKLIVKNFRMSDDTGRSINDFELSVRTRNALAAHGIKTVEQIQAMSKSDILAIPNLGKKSYSELMEFLYILER